MESTKINFSKFEWDLFWIIRWQATSCADRKISNEEVKDLTEKVANFINDYTEGKGWVTGDN